MCPAIGFGIVDGDAPVSYWFFLISNLLLCETVVYILRH